MATTTITDLPSSRALDYRAMSAIRGAAGAGDWCLSAFSPYQRAPLSPIAIYGTNYFAGQMNPSDPELRQQGLGLRHDQPSQNALNLIHAGPA
jgi:hypothetical protein